MVTATFRFYGGLSDFLPPFRRQRAFDCRCARAATSKHMIEALGVPHTEVGLVLVNGESCGFNVLLRDGDRVSIYPPFGRLDVAGISRLPQLPPGPPRFVADAHLGGLARLLRMAGFDTLYDKDADDGEIAAAAGRDGRVVLTRDRDLLKRSQVEHGCYVRALKANAQFKEVAERLGLGAHIRPFTLCLSCNAPLTPVDKAAVADRLPPAVRATHTEFEICRVCGGIFWKGSHWKRMCDALVGIAPGRGEAPPL